MKTRRAARILGAVVLALGVASGIASAGKPSGGGGGGGGTGGGTIYFSSAGAPLWVMDSAGGGKTALPVAGVPSRLLHGGHVWFLQVREIAGEFYPLGADGVAGVRREIFAVRDDDTLGVQLTSQADLEMDWRCEWMPGDLRISWNARRWAGGAVTEGGVHVADLVFDGDGNVVGLSAQPSAPAIAIPLVLWSAGASAASYFWGELGPDLLSHDWSPDGSRIVYDRFTGNDLWVADLSGGNSSLVPGFGRVPRWSPDGSQIAYNSSGKNGRGGISTVTPAGTGAKVIVNSGVSYSVGGAIWSPTGSHFVYARSEQALPRPMDVYRMTASGGSNTNLTGDIGTASPTAWR